MILLMKVLGRTRDRSEFIVEPIAEVEPVTGDEAIAALEALRAIAEDQRRAEVVHEN